MARLHCDPEFHARIARDFAGKNGGAPTIVYHLSIPGIARQDNNSGRPRKQAYGGWVTSVFRVLSKLRGLRGSRLDVFGYSAERRAERALIDEYEHDIAKALVSLSAETHPAALELARLPHEIRGYGPIKMAGIKATRARRDALCAQLTPAEHNCKT